MTKWVLTLLALVVAGCTVDGSLGRAEMMGTDAATTEADATSGGATSDAASSGPGAEGGSGGGTGGSDGRTDTTTGDTDNPLPTPDVACEPSDHDSHCATCRKEMCCTVLQACAAYDPCFCMWDCLLAPDHTEAGCAEVCAYQGQTVQEVRVCTEQHCAAQCLDGLDAHPAHDMPTDTTG